MNEIIEKRLNTLFEELVPTSGQADTEAGEIIRAVARINYRWYNDGDQLGIGYGKETCNPAARYLEATLPAYIGKRYWNLIYDPIYDESYDGEYDKELEELTNLVCNYIEGNRDERLMPAQDMWSFRVPEEDYDDNEEDDLW